MHAYKNDTQVYYWDQQLGLHSFNICLDDKASQYPTSPKFDIHSFWDQIQFAMFYHYLLIQQEFQPNIRENIKGE